MLALTSFASSMIWYISKNLFVYYVVYNTTYTNIYGSFSTILFFVVWLYISWVIYLALRTKFTLQALEKREKQRKIRAKCLNLNKCLEFIVQNELNLAKMRLVKK